MILGGVIVYQGRAELGPMLAVGCLGAIVGDSVGYWIGRRFGPALRKGPLGRRVGEERWDRASAYLRRRGGRAVFFGRFVGVLRALLPALAGSAGIPYRTFLPFSIAGGVTWVTAFVLLGYVAGGSYHIVERWAGRASLVLLALVVIIGLFVLGGRWAAHHVNELRARSARFLERPRVRKQRERYDRQISFLQRRFDPTARYGLYLTAGLVFSTVTAAIFGVVLEDIVASGERPFFDTRLLLFFRDHRTPALNDAMRAITTLGGSAFVAVVLAVATVVAYIRTRRAPLGSVLHCHDHRSDRPSPHSQGSRGSTTTGLRSSDRGWGLRLSERARDGGRCDVLCPGLLHRQREELEGQGMDLDCGGGDRVHRGAHPRLPRRPLANGRHRGPGAGGLLDARHRNRYQLAGGSEAGARLASDTPVILRDRVCGPGRAAWPSG